MFCCYVHKIKRGVFFCLKTRESSAYGVMKRELSVSKHTKHTFTLKTSKVKKRPLHVLSVSAAFVFIK